MKPLTRLERRALGLADHKGGCPISGPQKQPDGTRVLPKGHVNTQTANGLVTAGFALRVKQTLLITKAGRAEMNRPIPEDPDVFLRVGDGLTTSRKDAVLEELILDAHTLHPFWKEQALRNEAAAKDARQHAREIKRSSRNWPMSGPCGPVVVRFEDDEAA